eukprot:TRINITY_DN3131_c0_g1_i2.p1 TRINITY_DN3131_c0_g1~~TRINITY_DN3131_c0_g1_i2.p1  ORF type:complete len:1020 (+),score=278.08 TRINITY_DN3131_c0_g1_i2:52-3111(+)
MEGRRRSSRLAQLQEKRVSVEEGEGEEEQGSQSSGNVSSESETRSPPPRKRGRSKRTSPSKKIHNKRRKTRDGVQSTEDGTDRDDEVEEEERHASTTVIAQEEENMLYEMMMEDSIASIDFIGLENIDVVNFLIRCSGCLGSIPSEELSEDTQEFSSKLSQLLTKFPAGVSYPLIEKPHSKQKKFKKQFNQFLDRFVTVWCENRMEDIESALRWIWTLSSSKVRAFRHTATVAALRIVSSLIDVANEQRRMMAKVEDQVASIRNKKSQKRGKTATKPTKAQEKLVRDLQQTLESHHEKVVECEKLMKVIFNTVFVHRFRDKKSPEIRSVCITELCGWITNYRSHFLEDNYLKYVGWTLNDPDAKVRLAAISAVQKLSMPSMHSANEMALFNQRFKTRMCEMIRDVNATVAVTAVRTLQNIRNQTPDVLTEEDEMGIVSHITEENSRVRRACGEYVVARLFPKDDDQSRDGWLEKLVDYFSQFQEDIPLIGKYVVENVFPIHEEFRDTTILFKSLQHEQNSIVVQMVAYSLIQKAVDSSQSASISTYFPELMKSYASNDDEDLQSLLKSVVALDMEWWVHGKEKIKSFEVLGKSVLKAFQISSKREVILQAAEALNAILNGPATLTRKLRPQFDKMWESDLTAKFKSHDKDGILRVCCLLNKMSSMRISDAFGTLSDLLQDSNDEIVSLAIECGYFVILNDLLVREISEVESDYVSLCDHILSILELGSRSVQCRIAALRCLLDLLLILKNPEYAASLADARASLVSDGSISTLESAYSEIMQSDPDEMILVGMSRMVLSGLIPAARGAKLVMRFIGDDRCGVSVRKFWSEMKKAMSSSEYENLEFELLQMVYEEDQSSEKEDFCFLASKLAMSHVRIHRDPLGIVFRKGVEYAFQNDEHHMFLVGLQHYISHIVDPSEMDTIRNEFSRWYSQLREETQSEAAQSFLRALGGKAVNRKRQNSVGMEEEDVDNDNDNDEEEEEEEEESGIDEDDDHDGDEDGHDSPETPAAKPRRSRRFLG